MTIVIVPMVPCRRIAMLHGTAAKEKAVIGAERNMVLHRSPSCPSVTFLMRIEDGSDLARLEQIANVCHLADELPADEHLRDGAKAR